MACLCATVAVLVKIRCHCSGLYQRYINKSTALAIPRSTFLRPELSLPVGYHCQPQKVVSVTSLVDMLQSSLPGTRRGSPRTPNMSVSVEPLTLDQTLASRNISRNPGIVVLNIILSIVQLSSYATGYDGSMMSESDYRRSRTGEARLLSVA